MPSVGVLVEEACAVGKFYDNRFYLFTKDNQDLAEQAYRVMAGFNEKNRSGDFFNSYDLEVTEKPFLENHPAIKRTLDNEEYNILIQLNTPGITSKQFIVANIDESNVFINLGLMMYEAERISKAYFSKAVMNFAIEYPDEFCLFAKEISSDKKFARQYLSRLADNVMHPSFGMAASMSTIKKRLDIDGVITHKRMLDIYKNLSETLKQHRKNNDEKLYAELEVYIRSIDPTTLIKWIEGESPQTQKRFIAHTCPTERANASTMDLEIVYFEKAEKGGSTNGHYRLLMKKKYESLFVQFRLKNSFIVYLIYLLDRKVNGDNVDTLNLSKYKKLFVSLYKAVYGFGGETEFDNMMKRFTQDDTVKQKGFNTVFHLMKEDIGDTCERMREDPGPFLLRNCNAHLTILPKHIIIPDELMKLVKC